MYKKLLCILFLGLSSQFILSQPEELVFSTIEINRIYKQGSILYYSLEDIGINFIDLNDSNFTSQTLINTLDNPTGMEYKDGFLYVADWGAGKVIKLDLSQTNPSPIDVTLTGSTPNDLLFVGDILYYSVSSSNRIYQYDITTGTQMSEIAVITPNSPLGLEYKDDHMYIALPLFDAIYSFDLTDENAELEIFIENESSMNKPLNLEFYNDELYIANQFSDNILKVNVDNPPFNIEEVLSFNGARDLFIDQGMLYYCNSAYIYRVELSSLGIEEFSIKKHKLYPNPAQSEITISNLKSSKTYEIYDSVGRLIQKGMAKPNSSINLSGLINGYYLIKLKGTDEIFKFLKI